MSAANFLRTLKGIEGKIIVPGLGMVVGTLTKWSLERRDDGQPGSIPYWTLHGTLSYVNEPMLTSDKMNKKMTLVMSEDQQIEICSWDSITLGGTNIIAEGVIQCR